MYVLIAAHGTAVDRFHAVSDLVAERLARELAPRHATTKAVGYRLEREVDGSRAVVSAWVPYRVWRQQVAQDRLVAPNSQPHRRPR